MYHLSKSTSGGQKGGGAVQKKAASSKKLKSCKWGRCDRYL